MDRDIALKLVDALSSLKTHLTELATNTIPEEPVGSLGISPVTSTIQMEDAEIQQEETAEPEAEPEPTTRKKSTSK